MEWNEAEPNSQEGPVDSKAERQSRQYISAHEKDTIHTDGGKMGITIRRITKTEDINETKASASVGMRGIMVDLARR